MVVTATVDVAAADAVVPAVVAAEAEPPAAVTEATAVVLAADAAAEAVVEEAAATAAAAVLVVAADVEVGEQLLGCAVRGGCVAVTKGASAGHHTMLYTRVLQKVAAPLFCRSSLLGGGG